MKKRVRIYKSPESEGKFINKTAQFLNKAQMGGMPSVDMLGYPGASDQQMQESTQDQLASEVLTAISNSEPREKIIVSLVTIHGKDPLEAQQFVDQIYNYVEQQQQAEIDNADDENANGTLESVNEDVSVEEAQAAEPKSSYDSLINETIMEDNNPYDDTEEVSQILMKYGGSKKSYVSSALKLAKKEMGGNSKPNKFTDNTADPTGADVRKQTLNNFIGSVKNQSEMALIKKQAEEEYDNMMQMQQYPIAQEGGDMENPMHHLAAFSQYSGDVFSDNQNEIIQAQFGGLFRNMRQRRGIPSQFIQGMPVKHIDVTKSGLFGRPKRYSIDYEYSPMPGMGGNSYMQQPTVRKFEATRKKIEKKAEAVNEKAKEEIAKATPDSEATTKAVEKVETVTTRSTRRGTPVTRTVERSSETPIETIISPTGLTEGAYTYPGSNAIYRKQNETWYIDPTGTGRNYTPLNSGNVQERVRALESKAIPYENKILNTPYTSNPYNVSDAFNYNQSSNKVLDLRTPDLTKAPKPNTNIKSIMDMQPYGSELYYNPLKQEGGMVNNPFADMYGNLQQFVGGGNENFTQADLDDVYSKNTSNADFPMAKYGGLTEYQDKGEVDESDAPKVYDDKSIEALIEAYLEKQKVNNKQQPVYYNPYERQQPYYNNQGRTIMKGVPYDPATGMPVTNYMPGAGSYLKNVNVKRSSLLTGAPKKYTMTFGTQELDPRKQNMILPPGVKAKDYANWAADKNNTQNTFNSYAPEVNDNPNFDNLIWQSLMKADPNTLDTTVESDNPNASNPNWKNLDKNSRYRGLKRFLPRAQNGINYVYTNNPMMNGLNQGSLTAGDQGIQGLGQSPLTNAMDTSWMTNNNANITADQSQAPMAYTIDPNQLGSHQATQVYQGPDQDVSMDFKTKNTNENVRANLDMFNAGLRGFSNILEQNALKDSDTAMYDQMIGENTVGLNKNKNRGNYDTNSGLFRLDEMGQTQYSKYGGNIYEDGGMIEGDEVEMTEEEIQEFLANGGTLEFI